MTQRIVLAGGGHAHLSVLEDWLRRPSRSEQRILIMPSERSAYSGMLPGWMAGIYDEAALFIPVAQLARKAGAHVILATVTRLDPDTRQLHLSNGETQDFDILSLATGGETNAEGLEGLGDRLISIRPVEHFVLRWTEFLTQAAEQDQAHVAIVGAGAGGIELALAAKARLKGLTAQSRITIISPQDGFLPGHSPSVRGRAVRALKQRGIDYVESFARGTADGLVLDDGVIVSPDLVIAATGSKAQRWLAASGLGCSDDGYVSIDPTMQSVSHPNIFAAGDISQRVDRPLARSGVHAVKSGPVIAHNLRAFTAGEELREYQPAKRKLYLLSTADRRAILSWGEFCAEGKLPWHLKHWIDRKFVNHYTDLAN